MKVCRKYEVVVVKTSSFYERVDVALSETFWVGLHSGSQYTNVNLVKLTDYGLIRVNQYENCVEIERNQINSR